MSLFENLKRQRFLSFTVVVLTLCIGVLIGTVLNTGVKAARDGSVAPGATALQIPSPVQLQNSFSTIAKMLAPSVVNISSEYVQKASAVTPRRNLRRVPSPQQSPDEGDQGSMEDFFQRFFGAPGGGGNANPDQMPRGASLGSGFVVDRNGYILTNNHVIERANRIRVKFTDDPTEYEAKVIGADPLTDIAVIKIDKTNLIPVKIGNSDAIEVGDWAVAIGSPFGFQATVTSGIISAKSRDIPGEAGQSFQHFLQTDAAINPGNSGGPLLNINGEVIGINTQIASRTGGYQGIGFAMPVNTAVHVYNQIIKTGKVVRGSIGIKFQEGSQSRELLRAFHTDHGVFVQGVEPAGPAEKAGLKTADIITSINGKPIKRGQDLIDMISETPVGSSINVSYLREGKPETTEVTVGDRAKIFPAELGSADAANGDQGEDPGEATQARFGISIQTLTDRMKASLGVKENGIYVGSVEPGSFAEDIGLAKGDIITALNQKPVTTIEEFKRLQSTFKTGDAIAIRVLKNGGDPQKPNWQSAYLAGSIPASNQ